MKIGNRFFNKQIGDELSSFLGVFGTIDNKHMWSDGYEGLYPWTGDEVLKLSHSFHDNQYSKILIIKYA